MSDDTNNGEKVNKYIDYVVQNRWSGTNPRVSDRRTFYDGVMFTVVYDMPEKKDQLGYVWANKPETDLQYFATDDAIIRYFSNRERPFTKSEFLKIFFTVDVVGGVISIVFTLVVCGLLATNVNVLSNTFVGNAFTSILGFYFGRAAGRFNAND